MEITPDQISTLRNEASGAAEAVMGLSAKEGQIETELKDALRNRIANSPVIGERATAEADWLASGAKARNQYGNPDSGSFVFNPYQRDEMIATAKSQAYQPYAKLSDYIGLSLGQIPDLVESGMAPYRTELNQRNMAAQLAQSKYTNTLNEYMQMEQNRRANEQLALDKYKAYKGNGTQNALSSILASLVGGGQPTEAKPPMGMVNGKVYEYANGRTSPQGQWIVQNGQWVPNQQAGNMQGGDQMRQALGAVMMSIADSPADIKAAYEMMNPTEKAYQAKEAQAKASKQQAYDRATRLVDDAMKILNKGGNVSGFDLLGGIRKAGWLPGFKTDPEKAKLDTILSQLSGITAFDEAGKALTATELGIVGGKIPTVDVDEAQLQIMLTQILNDVEAKRNEYLFSQVGL